MNGTRDSGFSETIADETNFDSLDFNPEKIESISDAILNEGIEEKQQTDLLSNVEQTLITIVNTIVQAEIKENNPDGLIDDKSNLIIDVNIHKSFEEIVFESKNNELKDVISLPEIKPMQETSIKLDSEKVTNQNSNNIVLIDQVPLDNAKLDKKSKKSKNFIKSLFSRIQKPKKIDSSVKVVETSEFVPTVNHVTNNNIIKKEETSVLEQHEILDNEQKLRVKQMRNKASDVILDKLKLENFFVDGKNETTIKNLVLRSIDLIRYNKIQSFKQLGDSLKKEFFMINDEKTIDKLVSSLEDFLITKRVLKDLDLQPEKYEVIMFPCDFEPKTFQAKIDTKQVAEVSTSLNDVKENPAPVETNFKSQTNSSKFSWAIGLDSSPGSNKVYEKENPNSSQAVYANSITSNPSIVNEKKMEIDKAEEEKINIYSFDNLRWFEANEKLRYFFYRSNEMSSKVKYSEENNLFSILIKTR